MGRGLRPEDLPVVKVTLCIFKAPWRPLLASVVRGVSGVAHFGGRSQSKVSSPSGLQKQVSGFSPQGRASGEKKFVKAVDVSLREASPGRCFPVAVGGKKGGFPRCPGWAQVLGAVSFPSHPAGNRCSGGGTALLLWSERAFRLHKYSFFAPFLHADAACLCTLPSFSLGRCKGAVSLSPFLLDKRTLVGNNAGKMKLSLQRLSQVADGGRWQEDVKTRISAFVLCDPRCLCV